MKNLSLINILILIFIGACTDQNDVSLEFKLMDILNSDDMLGMEGFDTNGDAELNFDMGLETEGLAKTLNDTLGFGEGYRIRFGRRINENNRVVEFEIDGDIAIGLINYNINGTLYVKAFDTTDNDQIDSISFEKDFSTNFKRKVLFTQVDNPNNPDGYDWTINALTPLVGGSGDKIEINNIHIYELTETMVNGVLLYQYSSDGIDNLFINRDSLPVFNAFTPYLIEVYTNNSGPELSNDSTGVGEWVFKNYGRGTDLRGRKHLNDKGRQLDSLMNDNIHTGGWRAHGPGLGLQRRGFRSFFETIDLATIFVEDGGYNTSVWSIPYRIQRP